MEGLTRTVWIMAECIQPISAIDSCGCIGKCAVCFNWAGFSWRNNVSAGQYDNQSTSACQWCKKGRYHEETGRSRGGLTTKVHVVTDGLGNPLHFLLSSGNRNDICMAQELLSSFDLCGKLILADRGYDSNKFVNWIESRRGIAVIPSRSTAKIPRDIDWSIYNERHLVENLFLKLKNNRRFTTRYEKKSVFFKAITSLSCILVWLLWRFANTL